MGDLLEHTWGTRELSVLDPFAGGGSIPFEALRYGFTTLANDLNPVAALLTWAALAIMALTLGIGAMRFAWRYFILGHARRIEEALRNLIFGRILNLSAAQLGERTTGDLMAHATNDVEAVRMAAGMGVVALVDGIVLGAAAIGFMLYINVTLTLIAAIPMPAVAIITRFQSREVHRRFREVQAGFSTLTEWVPDAPAGIFRSRTSRKPPS